LMPKERPRRRPLASAILRWRTCGWAANASAMSGWARRQWPHHGLPRVVGSLRHASSKTSTVFTSSGRFS
jgi:hypothetical protein